VWDTKPEAHQEDVPTSGTDTQNVFLCRGLRDRTDVISEHAVALGDTADAAGGCGDGRVGMQDSRERLDAVD
jgi:hypothetical protein